MRPPPLSAKEEKEAHAYIAYIAIATLRSSLSFIVLVLPSLFTCVLILARVPGLSLCLALLDIVRRSQTHACPRITLCLACVVPVCHCMNLACFVTTSLK